MREEGKWREEGSKEEEILMVFCSMLQLCRVYPAD